MRSDPADAPSRGPRVPSRDHPTGAERAIELRIDATRYLSEPKPTRIRRELTIHVSEHCFLPRDEDLASDWVAHVAVPAFRLLRRERGGGRVESFCSIGTGAGLDVLSAIEVFDATRVGLTDVHEDVVAAAVGNVRRNLAGGQPVAIEAGHGDLLEPLRPLRPRYDVVYENLPNVPAESAAAVAVERTSSTHVPPRAEAIPPEVKRQMLDLHYVALRSARDFLAPGGAVLSMLGARVPLEVFLRMGEAAGVGSSFLAYTWKVQAEGESVIRDHAERQRRGFGPFHFYRADALRRRFASVDFATSGAQALEIERSLAPERLDAVRAWEAFQAGERIGHTAVVLKSVAR
jgi:methylase of polypeptide subunit release factors